jgi:hypothetical protein
MGQCMAMGQAAGTAAAICAARKHSPRELGVSVLRQQLREDGVILSLE